MDMTMEQKVTKCADMIIQRKVMKRVDMIIQRKVTKCADMDIDSREIGSQCRGRSSCTRTSS